MRLNFRLMINQWNDIIKVKVDRNNSNAIYTLLTEPAVFWIFKGGVFRGTGRLFAN